MITKRTDLSPNQDYIWIDARELDKDDISILTDEYLISSELLADIMDADEQSRIEKEDEYTVIICRLPSSEEDDDKPLERTSIPLGIVLFPDKLITICRGDSVVIDDFARHRFRQCPVETKEGFVISILGRAALVYIRLLKYINRQKDIVEEQLQKSIMNYELIQLLQIQKSLVYLTTGLTDNELLLEKLQKTPYFRVNSEAEEEFLEDSITDNKQAIAMANIYSDILTGTMDAFASVIGNNMNEQHERDHEEADRHLALADVPDLHHGILRHERVPSRHGQPVRMDCAPCSLRHSRRHRQHIHIRQAQPLDPQGLCRGEAQAEEGRAYPFRDKVSQAEEGDARRGGLTLYHPYKAALEVFALWERKPYWVILSSPHRAKQLYLDASVRRCP